MDGAGAALAEMPGPDAWASRMRRATTDAAAELAVSDALSSTPSSSTGRVGQRICARVVGGKGGGFGGIGREQTAGGGEGGDG